MKPNGFRNTDDVSEVLKAILIGLFLYCHFATPTTDDVECPSEQMCVVLQMHLKNKGNDPQYWGKGNGQINTGYIVF